ncbi:hypothetical protein PoB_001245800 [Plakobranchus ocellatus]|uniref:Uncharacterized protein n=1 Tax=Plakobranchus ocellatus TaxID=259542 RepID=A0AAV3YTS3_9GAST|nr:hypothetical protein PoB_001245800 [Plakobranchus ocellatus]
MSLQKPGGDTAALKCPQALEVRSIVRSTPLFSGYIQCVQNDAATQFTLLKSRFFMMPVRNPPPHGKSSCVDDDGLRRRPRRGEEGKGRKMRKRSE